MFPVFFPRDVHLTLETRHLCLRTFTFDVKVKHLFTDLGVALFTVGVVEVAFDHVSPLTTAGVAVLALLTHLQGHAADAIVLSSMC